MQALQHSLFGHVVEEQATVVKAPVLKKVPLQEAIFTVIDLETTGLSAKKNSITEVTAIQFQNGREVGKYSTLIKPLEPISEEVELLTGISNETVRHAPSIMAVLSELSTFVGQYPLIVGHNVPFDVGFLVEKCQQNGLDVFMPRYDLERSFCTKKLAQKALPGLPSYEGIVVATAVGYHNDNPHRAEADVRMSAAILFAIIEQVQAQDDGFKSVQDLLKYQGSLK